MSPSYAGIIAKAIMEGKTEEEIAKAAEELGKNTEEATTQAPATQNGGTATNVAKTVAASTGATGATGAASTTSTNPDVAAIYEVLAPMAGDYLNAQAEQIGMAQRSMGPLAAAAMGQSQTAGLGNYTYNRLMRPQVDTMRDEIRVQGYANQLNRLLSDALNRARNNYNRGGGSSGGSTSGSSDGWDGEIEEEQQQKDALYLTGSEAWAMTYKSDRLFTKDELEEMSGRPMTQSEYEQYVRKYNQRQRHKK